MKAHNLTTELSLIPIRKVIANVYFIFVTSIKWGWGWTSDLCKSLLCGDLCTDHSV